MSISMSMMMLSMLSLVLESDLSFIWMLDLSHMPMTMSTSVENVSFYCLVMTVSTFVILWSNYYMSDSYKLSLFYTTLFLFVFSMLLLILSNSLLALFLGWEGLGVTSFLLIIFYQNWMSFKGGLITILTNRLGDAILIFCFCYWFMTSSSFSLESSLYGVVFLLITLTKSAQWPFISWLPAAMAAPTPVSALVHSSTLVTAGVWLLIRFGLYTMINVTLVMMAGLTTLSIASLSALIENDAKKVVALSTLSQLGLMFISLALGNSSICMFHILMHALAKANLFMVVGVFLHSSFAQQDLRGMAYASKQVLNMSMIVSMLSLSGMVFSSGFFSKEQILMNHYMITNSSLSFFMLLTVSGLTVSYCTKLFLSLNEKANQAIVQPSSMGMSFLIPILSLTSLSTFMGYLYSSNFIFFPFLKIFSGSGAYWAMLVWGAFLSFFPFKKLTMSFIIHTKWALFTMGPLLSISKKTFIMSEKTLSDAIFMATSLSLNILFKQSIHVLLLSSVVFFSMMLL